MRGHAKPVDFRELLAEHLALIRARTEGEKDMWGYLEQTREEAHYLIEQGIFVSRADHEEEIADVESSYDNGLVPSLEATIDHRDKTIRALEQDIDDLVKKNDELKASIIEMKPVRPQVPEYGVRWNDGSVKEYGNLQGAIAAYDKWHWPEREVYVSDIVVRDVEISDWRVYDDRIERGRGGSTKLL